MTGVLVLFVVLLDELPTGPIVGLQLYVVVEVGVPTTGVPTVFVVVAEPVFELDTLVVDGALEEGAPLAVSGVWVVDRVASTEPFELRIRSTTVIVCVIGAVVVTVT